MGKGERLSEKALRLDEDVGTARVRGKMRSLQKEAANPDNGRVNKGKMETK